MNEVNYEDYLKSKSRVFKPIGINEPIEPLNDMLWDYQCDIVQRNLYAGRFLNMLDCGLGKTPIQLEWCHQVALETGKPTLSVAPLQVCYQTVRESHKFNRPVEFHREPPKKSGANIITNYENVHKFDPNLYGGLNLDESSRLKHYASKTRMFLSEFVKDIPFRLCNSATPSPNDDDEFLNHLAHLGIGTRNELKGEFFIQDGNNSTKFKLIPHSVDDWWQVVASVCVAMRMPSDLGYGNDNYTRGELIQHNVVLPSTKPTNGMLFPLPARTLSERHAARRDTIEERCQLAATLVNNADAMSQYVPDYDINESVVIWCDRVAESSLLTKLINDSVEVKGGTSAKDVEINAQKMIDFTDGKFFKLVTKPSIAGHGMNWQHARIMLFVGLSDSFEQVYQAIRRLWRNMQLRDVHVIFITSELEGGVLKNQKRKNEQHEKMYDNIIANISQYWTRVESAENEYNPQQQIIVPKWLRSN